MTNMFFVNKHSSVRLIRVHFKSRGPDGEQIAIYPLPSIKKTEIHVLFQKRHFGNSLTLFISVSLSLSLSLALSFSLSLYLSLFTQTCCSSNFIQFLYFEYRNDTFF